MLSRRDFIKGSAVAMFTLATNIFPADVQAATCQAKTAQGTYRGFIDKRGIQTWLGIPYAKPPVGKLRWHAPEPLPPSNKTFDAKKFGYSAIQDRDETEPASLLEQSEDCLTLNIWTRGGKNLPVMVWIHGGGFINGGTGDPLYNGSNLAAHDVVVVTINYRLNLFGFMNFAAIDSAFEDTGYLGIKDQVAALTWVKENISSFGGDPDNVTIFGESAGSISATLLMVTPAAKGLFNKVIAQSGHMAYYHVPEHSAERTAKFMELGGYKNMQELMTKTTAELFATYEKFCDELGFEIDVGFFPTCDGKYLPAHPLRELKDGAARGIKLLTGNTAEEYRYWALYYEGFMELMADAHPKLTPVIYEGEFLSEPELYQSWQKNHSELEELERYLEFANQLDWRVGQELMAEYQSAFEDVYFYLFNQKSPYEHLGSCHAIDLPFVFGNPSEDIEPNPSPALIAQVQAAWVSFATSGKPSSDWKKYSTDDRETMEINSKAWTCRPDLNSDNLKELRHVYENHLLD